MTNSRGNNVIDAPVMTEARTAEAESLRQSPSLPPEKTTPKNGTNKGGAPLGSMNALKHGLRGVKFHPDWRPDERKWLSYRKWARAEVMKLGPLTGLAEALLHSAARHEQIAILATRYLREKGPDLGLQELLRVFDTVQRATTARDACLARAGLKTSPDPGDLGGLYAALSARIEATATEKSAPASQEPGTTADSRKPAKRSPAFPNASKAKGAQS